MLFIRTLILTLKDTGFPDCICKIYLGKNTSANIQRALPPPSCSVSNKSGVMTLLLALMISRWKTERCSHPFFDNKKTGQTLKVIDENAEEKMIVNRRKGIDKTGKQIFDNDPSLKSTVRERFFVHKTGKFSDGSTPGEKYKQHASIYFAILNYIKSNSPLD